MARTTATNFSGGLQFPYATAATDLFKKEDVQTLALAVDQHDHTGGKGLVLSASSLPDGSITGAKIATNTVTSANITDGTIQAVDLASGAAAANVGALGGELGGTLPNPILKHVTSSVSGLGATAVSVAASWTVWGQATSVVLTGGVYLIIAAGTYQTTPSTGLRTSVLLGFGSSVAGTVLVSDTNTVTIDNAIWRVRLVAIVSVPASYSPWLQVFAGAVGTISDGKCDVVKLA